MKTFNYNVNLNGLDIIKTDKEQNESFFYQGHPKFLIPDFCSNQEDLWLTFMDYLESTYNKEVYDQDGGEIESNNVIDPNTGLTQCKYVAYGVNLDEDDDPVDIEVDIEGYVVRFTMLDSNDVYFLATKVIEKSNF